MKGNPAYQQLEEALREERAGSAKIRALSHYVQLKQAESMIEREREQGLIGDDTFTHWERQKLILEVTIEHQYFTADAYEYAEAFDNAGTIVAPYLKLRNVNPYQTFLHDLRAINREKSEKTKQRAWEKRRAWEEYR